MNCAEGRAAVVASIGPSFLLFVCTISAWPCLLLSGAERSGTARQRGPILLPLFVIECSRSLLRRLLRIRCGELGIGDQ